jgi:hypothetical protein
VNGGGLLSPGQIFPFPSCISVVNCSGSDGALVSFVRRRATNLCDVSLMAYRQPFARPLRSAPVEVTLSLGGVDARDQAGTCRLTGRGGRVDCRK